MVRWKRFSVYLKKKFTFIMFFKYYNLCPKFKLMWLILLFAVSYSVHQRGFSQINETCPHIAAIFIKLWNSY